MRDNENSININLFWIFSQRVRVIGVEFTSDPCTWNIDTTYVSYENSDVVQDIPT